MKLRSTDDGRTFEISTFKVLGTVTLTGVVSAIVTVLTFALIQLPAAREKIKASESQRRDRLVQLALQASEASERAMFLHFLVSSELLSDPNGYLKHVSSVHDSVPHWPAP